MALISATRAAWDGPAAEAGGGEARMVLIVVVYQAKLDAIADKLTAM
jgi:hypothetical protein